MSNILHQMNIDQNQISDFMENFTIVVDFMPFFDRKTQQRIHSPGVIALYIFLLILVEILGNFLLVCMIMYEKYGMDAQKRTVTNQLLSRMIFVQILCNIFITPFFTFNVIFGPPSKFSIITHKDRLARSYDQTQTDGTTT